MGVENLEKYVIDTLGIPYVSFNGLSLEMCKEIIEALTNVFRNYPSLANSLCAIGDRTNINNQFNVVCKNSNSKWENFVLPKEEQDGLYAAVAKGRRAFTIKDDQIIQKQLYVAIAYNDKLKNRSVEEHENTQKEGIIAGLHPNGYVSFKYDIYHELGHIIDYVLDISHSKEFVSLIKPESANIYDKISAYACNGLSDLFAEAFAQNMLNPNTNELVRAIGMLTDNKYKKLENSNIFNINQRFKKSSNIIEKNKRKL